MKIGGDIIWENSSVKLLEMTYMPRQRMCSFLSQNKKRIIFKSFVKSQFKNCPLTWMFCSRKSNSKINRLHERSL